MEEDAGVRAIFQQWQNVKTEYGTVERRFTQCAQTWPLASNVKLENMETAIHLVRQACDYLCSGMTQMGSVTDRKCDAEKVQQVISEVMTQFQKLQVTMDEKSRRVETIASRVDELSGESMNSRSRLEGLERCVGVEGQQHDSAIRDLRASLVQCIEDTKGLCKCSTEYQMDIQFRDTELFELKELLFKFSIDLEDGLKECHEGIQRAQQLPERGLISTSDHQEHMNAVQQALEEQRTQILSHEKKLLDDERQTRRLQEEVAAHRAQPRPEVPEGFSLEVQVAMETRFVQIEEALRKGQKQYSQWETV